MSGRKKPDLLLVVAVVIGIGGILAMKAQAGLDDESARMEAAEQTTMLKKQPRLNPFMQ